LRRPNPKTRRAGKVIQRKHGLDAWLQSHLNSIALLIILAGFVIRAITAAASYLNPDEALHYLLANQPSVALAYQATLTNAHPPFFFLLLYFLRFIGTSELILRLPSVLAGTLLLWVTYKWLESAFNKTAALIALLMLTFSPAIISASTEVRGYGVLLLCMASALYFLERAFKQKSLRAIILFSVALYLAILTHYSAFWFTLAAAAYAVILVFSFRPSTGLVKVWAASQAGAVSLYVLLYVTHISKLRGGGMEREASGGWLQSSYFDPAKDDLFVFLFNGTVGFFHYVCANRIVGIAVLLSFVAGVVVLITKDVRGERRWDRLSHLAILLLPFLLSWCAALARMYPYGGTRHSIFLALFAISGASFGLTRLIERKPWPGLLAVGIAMAVCNLYPTPPAQPVYTEHQSRALMSQAVNHIHQSIPAGKLVFVDYQTSVLLGYYLGRNQITRFDQPETEFWEFPYGGYRIVSARHWLFDIESFGVELKRLRNVYDLPPGEMVWIVSAGWGVNLYTRLSRRFPESYFPGTMFGSNLAVFQVPTV
jgi:Dolichyl-phosphate-mannose-protein mannosyltransferase